MRAIIKYLAIVVLLFVCGEVTAQQMKERGLVRKGNREFKREQFEKSVDSYQRALQHDTTCFEAKYDLASALYRTERYDKAYHFVEETKPVEVVEEVEDAPTKNEKGEQR